MIRKEITIIEEDKPQTNEVLIKEQKSHEFH